MNTTDSLWETTVNDNNISWDQLKSNYLLTVWSICVTMELSFACFFLYLFHKSIKKGKKLKKNKLYFDHYDKETSTRLKLQYVRMAMAILCIFDLIQASHHLLEPFISSILHTILQVIIATTDIIYVFAIVLISHYFIFKLYYTVYPRIQSVEYILINFILILYILCYILLFIQDTIAAMLGHNTNETNQISLYYLYFMVITSFLYSLIMFLFRQRSKSFYLGLKLQMKFNLEQKYYYKELKKAVRFCSLILLHLLIQSASYIYIIYLGYFNAVNTIFFIITHDLFGHLLLYIAFAIYLSVRDYTHYKCQSISKEPFLLKDMNPKSTSISEEKSITP